MRFLRETNTARHWIMYVRADGTVLRFCSRRCFVSMIKYNRDPRKLTWFVR